MENPHSEVVICPTLLDCYTIFKLITVNVSGVIIERFFYTIDVKILFYDHTKWKVKSVTF